MHQRALIPKNAFLPPFPKFLMVLSFFFFSFFFSSHLSLSLSLSSSHSLLLPPVSRLTDETVCVSSTESVTLYEFHVQTGQRLSQWGSVGEWGGTFYCCWLFIFIFILFYFYFYFILILIFILFFFRWLDSISMCI